MFRLLRLVFFTLFAFVAGILTERSNAHVACRDLGGDWIKNLCVGSDIPND